MGRISPSDYKSLLPEGMRRLFDDIVFALMRHGGIKKAEAEEMTLTELVKVRNHPINYFAMPSSARNSFATKCALGILDKKRKAERAREKFVYLSPAKHG